jgi:hypothetical protein
MCLYNLYEAIRNVEVQSRTEDGGAGINMSVKVVLLDKIHKITKDFL